MKRAMIHRVTTRCGLMMAIAALAACATSDSQQPSMANPAVVTNINFPGVETYVPIAHISQVPFVVIEVVALAGSEVNFDFWLRDALMAIGFPNGLTRGQLARRMVEAGVADSARSTTDLIALRQLARVVGPFLRLRVQYETGGWGKTSYRAELWDISTATLVYAAQGKKMVWLRVSDELGPQIIADLKKWREASLVAEAEAAAGESAR